MTPYLKTKRLRIYAPFHRKPDIATHVIWLHDKEVIQFSEQRWGLHTEDSQRSYIEAFDHVSTHFWEFSHKHGCYDYPVGTITASRDLMNMTANVGIMVGNRWLWGKGYGTEAWTAVCDWLFTDGVRKIEAGTMACNTAMMKIFERYGMRLEASVRQHFMVKGKPEDMLLYCKFNGESHAQKESGEIQVR